MVRVESSYGAYVRVTDAGTELGVSEAYQGIVNWEPGISGLGDRGVGWSGLGWGRVRDLGQACCACW